ncbi:Uncharacterized protein FWK35_00020775 [Aphis craccivora]|uniref:Uncharacterized protein n=1 Tax=Aphis craccivora TaxID=307492 RepID=A0A6G0Y2E3_APHCR|nr:Uncharacterized protein FWK35_00020775 [Aphis craccivora]
MLVKTEFSSTKEFGLQKKYSEDPEFALQIRMLPALAFVPKDDIISSYNVLIESNYYTKNEEILEQFLDYFENTWIGKLDRKRRRKQPKFEIEMWNCWHNCFTSIISGKYPSIWRFIEALKKEESINRLKIEHEDPEFALQIRMLPALAFVSKDDIISSYNVLIESNYYTENEEILEQFLDYFENTWIGKLPQKKKYQDRAKRIKNICTDYNDLFILDYLRGIAYNFQLQI